MEMSPMQNDEQQRREDRATQSMDCLNAECNNCKFWELDRDSLWFHSKELLRSLKLVLQARQDRKVRFCVWLNLFPQIIAASTSQRGALRFPPQHTTKNDSLNDGWNYEKIHSLFEKPPKNLAVLTICVNVSWCVCACFVSVWHDVIFVFYI